MSCANVCRWPSHTYYAYDDHTIARMAQITPTTTTHYLTKFYAVEYQGVSTTEIETPNRFAKIHFMTTKHMEISTRYNPDEIVSRIGTKTDAISSCFAYMIATTYGKESKLVGEVSRHRIMVARARPLTHNSSRPVFNGTLIEESGNTVLRGKFEYNCFRKYFFWVSSVIFAAAEMFILIGIFAPENQPIYGLRNIVVISVLPGLQLVAYLFTRYVKDPLFEADREWIENELSQLLA